MSSTRMSKVKAGGGFAVTSSERDAILEDLKKKDDESGKKSGSRTVVEKYLSKFDWYWPRRLEKGDRPDLYKAWAYYEHNTLPRYITGESDAEHTFRKAERGEFQEDTALYPALCLPQRAIIEWGAGMDLYFISVWFFAFVMLACGCINLLSIIHFRGTDYNGDSEISEASIWLQGSAVCLNNEWVICSDCVEESWNDRPNKATDRFARINSTLQGLSEDVVLVKENLCKFDENNLGWPNFATLLFLLVVIFLFNMYLRAREIRFDEDKLTTTDYSIVVKNPPADAKNPDEWREFFNTFTLEDQDQVTAITVALNNQDLVTLLANRRVARRNLGFKLGDEVDLDDETAVRLAIDKHNQELAEKKIGCIGYILKCLRPLLKLAGMMYTADELYENITKWTKKIKELQEKEYQAVRVFVTFETEQGQRNALSQLNVGKADLKANRVGSRPPELLFRGKFLVDAQEPAEPSAIRYTELGFSEISRAIRRVITFSVTVLLVALAGYLVTMVRNDSGAANAGYVTTASNSVIPVVLKLLLIVEKHETEGEYQRSVYLKLTLFRWTLSGFLTSFIVPFTSSLGDSSTDMVPAIAGLLFAELWLTPLLKIVDIMPNINKHIFAPRANSQDEMNMNFNGSYFQLGERYTDFTKILFMVFYYSALFPAGFFFGFVILLIQYYLDKFSLTRLWQPTPKLGADLATFSRKFSFTVCLLGFALASSFWWAEYPYDNLCPPVAGQESSRWTNVVNFTNVIDIDGNYITGGINLVDIKDDSDNVIGNQVSVRGTEFLYCEQDWRAWPGLPFPATPRVQSEDGAGWFSEVDEDDLKWMSDSQSLFTRVYGWTSVVVLFVLLFGLFARQAYKHFISVFVGVYEPEGEVQNVDFSSNIEIFGYVPEIKRGGQSFPFLCCDCDDYDENLISWADENQRCYDYHNLIFDIPHKSLRRQEIQNEDPLFEDPDMVGFHRSRYLGKPPRVPQDYENSIYSIVKHYPTKWQVDLAKKEGIQFEDKTSFSKGL